MDSWLRPRIDFDRYRLIMGSPTWGWLCCAVIRTRSYQEGIRGAELMLHLTHHFKPRMPPKQYEKNVQKCQCLILDCLDRLDRYDEFLSLYPQLRGWSIYRTWLDYRVRIVARKAKSAHPRPHQPQEGLTDKEINDRWDWVFKMAREDIKQKGICLALYLLFSSAVGSITWLISLSRWQE